MITPSLDLFAIFIFLAVFQSLVLSAYFYIRKERGHLSHVTLSAILFCFALILFDIASGYSGYIVKYIYLNNFSDPFVFFLGPLCYFYTKSTAQNTKKINHSQYLHFIIPVLMLLYYVLYFMQPDGLKYNDFLSAFHPQSKINYVEPIFEPDPFAFLKNIVLLMVTHLSIYIILSIRIINRILKPQGSNFFSFSNSTQAPLRFLLSGFVLALIVFSFIKLFFYNDLGDHIIAMYTSLIVYSITIYLFSKKYFSEEDEEDEKS